jgi:acyl-CoA reductase-like NAD-dependent aldehyde dehydrogenase
VFRVDPVTGDELSYAVDASAFACRKALAGLDYLGWRRRPAASDARVRRRLARELASLAAEQQALARRLRSLWLRRSRPSNFEITKRRLDRSIASLRRAARSLQQGRPPAPPPPHPGFGAPEVFRRLKEAAQGRAAR